MYLPRLSGTITSHVQQTVFAGDLVLYCEKGGIRVFPVPELAFPAPGYPISVELESVHTLADVATRFASLPVAPFNIDHPNIWQGDAFNIARPDMWNHDLGIPFVFDIFFSNEEGNTSDRGVTVTRYRLDIEWDRSNASQAPSYTLSVVDTFTFKSGPHYRTEYMNDMDLDALGPLKSHVYVMEIEPPDLDLPAQKVGFSSYTVVRKSDQEAVRKGLEQAGRMDLGRETTAVAKLCTVTVKDADGNSWALDGRSGRVAGAKTVRVLRDEGQGRSSNLEDEDDDDDDDDDDDGYDKCLEIVVHDFLSG